MNKISTTPTETEYRNYSIRTNGERFAVINPDGTPDAYDKCRDIDAAKARIDALYARSEALIAEAAKQVCKPQFDASAILTAADRFAANARKMGRRENNPDDLI